MNCFSHARLFLDDPWFAIGTCLPDWLSACDRRCRARSDAAGEWADADSPDLAALARGVVRHHHDDDWFHRSRIFAETNLQFSVEIRELLGREAGFRPGLLGHIVIELFLDAWLDGEHPGQLDRFYAVVGAPEPGRIESLANRFTSRPTIKLAWYVERFLGARYIFDYRDDRRLLLRMNQVLKRVGLSPVGRELDDWLPAARQQVYDRAEEYLSGFAGISGVSDGETG